MQLSMMQPMGLRFQHVPVRIWSVEVTCDVGGCPELIIGMQNIAPIIKTQADDEISVKVTYTCPASDYVAHQGLYLVTLTVAGAKHYLTVPAVLGLDVAIDLQPFKLTRLSEDLHTSVSGG